MKKRIIPIALLILPLIFIITYVHVLFYYFENKGKIFESYVNKLEKEYCLSVNGYTNIADIIYEGTVNQDKILRLLYSAYNEKEKIAQSEARDYLYKELYPVYKTLVKYDFRQFHFHTSDNISFLRFHKPEQFGDDLTEIRTSIRNVNRDFIKKSGFEEGRVFNGYRNVYPLFFNESHIGSVEISISMNAIIKNILSQESQRLEFIILKSIVDEKVFDSEKNNYLKWSVSEDYLLDKDVNVYSLLDGTSFENKELVIKNLANSQLSGKGFSIRLKIENSSSIVTFLPIKNFDNIIEAYLISFSNDQKLCDFNNSFIMMNIAFVLLMILSSGFILYILSAHKKIESLLIHDQLTGALTRNSIFQKIENCFFYFKRYGRTFSVSMIDIDYFKRVNDVYGHPVGDIILREVVNVILENIRVTDSIGRYGGEEFILLFPETDTCEANIITEKIKEKISHHLFSEVGNITVSIGVASIIESIDDFKKLIEIADKRLYLAKKNGRNQVVCADDLE